MEQIALGTSGLVTSRLGMGCAKLGSATAGHSRRGAVRLVGEACDAGIRLFDTADAYGAGVSESALGEAVRSRRDELVIATKVGYRFRQRSVAERQARRLVGVAKRAVAARRHGDDPSGVGGPGGGGGYESQDFAAGYVRSAVLASLRRLGIDRIDLLQFHGPPDPERADALPEVIARLLADGLVGAFGIGCESLETAAAWLDVPGLACLQIPFGVLDPQAATTVIPAARDRGVGVLVRGVLGGGILTRRLRGVPTGLDAVRQRRVEDLEVLAGELGVDVLQLAVWYGLGATGADAMLLGMTTTEQVHSNVAMVDNPPPAPDVVERICAAVGAHDA